MAIKISGSTIIDDSRNIVSGAAATFTGNVTIGGTLTYEDVTNIDSVGIITAGQGVRITAGGLNVVGITTFTDDVRITGGGLDVVGVVSATSFDGSLAASNLTGALPAISGANLTNLTAGNLTGTLPAISGANLTNLTAGNLTGTLPAISGANLTNLTAGNLTGALPAIDGSALTGITGGLFVQTDVGIHTLSKVGVGTTNPIAQLDVNVGSSVTALNIEGSEGQLFTVTNSLSSGSIFAVNDISGMPSIDVNADGTIQLAPFGAGELVGIGTTVPSSKLHVVGDTLVTGVTTISNDLHIKSTLPRIYLTDTNHDSDWYIGNSDGTIVFYDETTTNTRFEINPGGSSDLPRPFIRTPFNTDSVLRGHTILGGHAASPNHTLTVAGISTFNGAINAGDDLTVSHSGLAVNIFESTDNHSRLRIKSSDASLTQLEFADQSDADAGEIRYDHGNDRMTFHVGNNDEKFRIDSRGAVTKPDLPSFHARPPASYSLGDNVNAVVGGTWSTSGTGSFVRGTLANGNSIWNNTNGIFTVPVTGIYFLHWTLFLSNNSTRRDAFIYLNGTNTGDIIARTEIQDDGSGMNKSVAVSTVLSLSVNDTVRFGARTAGGTTIYTSAAPWSYACGHLVG